MLLEMLKIKPISVITFADYLKNQRPPSGEQSDLTIAINSLLFLIFCDLWAPLKLIKN